MHAAMSTSLPRLIRPLVASAAIATDINSRPRRSYRPVDPSTYSKSDGSNPVGLPNE